MRFENTEVMNFPAALRGMRNTYEPLTESDSGICKGGDNGIGCNNCCRQPYCTHAYDREFKIGKRDMALAQRLIRAGVQYREFLGQIFVSFDITYLNRCKNCYQTKTVTRSYEELREAYRDKRDELYFCRETGFVSWVMSLPYAREFILYETIEEEADCQFFCRKKDWQPGLPDFHSECEWKVQI